MERVIGVKDGKPGEMSRVGVGVRGGKLNVVFAKRGEMGGGLFIDVIAAERFDDKEIDIRFCGDKSGGKVLNSLGLLSKRGEP